VKFTFCIYGLSRIILLDAERSINFLGRDRALQDGRSQSCRARSVMIKEQRLHVCFGPISRSTEYRNRLVVLMQPCTKQTHPSGSCWRARGGVRKLTNSNRGGLENLGVWKRRMRYAQRVGILAGAFPWSGKRRPLIKRSILRSRCERRSAKPSVAPTAAKRGVRFVECQLFDQVVEAGAGWGD